MYADLLFNNAHLGDGSTQVVYNAIKVGYRLLDGAGEDYGNEKEAGEGLRRALDEGIVKREELCKLQSCHLCLICTCQLQSSRPRLEKGLHSE
jgi:hypothetical protein